MDETDKDYLENLKRYILKAEDRVKYSIERFDILIISLSSGGLLLGISLYSNFKSSDKNLINHAWMYFSISLILNLLSQVTGYLANKYDIKCTNNIIYEIEGKEIIGKPKLLEIIHKCTNILTNWLNIFSFLSLSVGIILLVIFVNYKI